MFESSHLVPNLNKIMEDYRENEEESIQEVQSGVDQETEEIRNRNRGAEEAETE